MAAAFLFLLTSWITLCYLPKDQSKQIETVFADNNNKDKWFLMCQAIGKYPCTGRNIKKAEFKNQ